jgi:glycosyltransferase involved in cell wall biosynthesis
MISIVYITYRENCGFEWFIESLCNQATAEQRAQIQLIIVDGLLFESDQPVRRAYFQDLIQGQIESIHVSPKPTMWQGQYRVTKDNYFAAANTRNTGACYAKHPYIAFVDDLGVLGPNWLEAVFEGSRHNHIYCGAYTKVKDMVVKDGKFISGNTQGGVDHRLAVYSQDVSVVPGAHMYGSSFCMPLCWLFELNGLNEMCDGMGGEDYDFGIRIVRQGKVLQYNKRMFIHESDHAYVGSDYHRKCIRADPVLPDTEYAQRVGAYGIPNHSGRKDVSHFMLSYASHGPSRVNPEFSIESYNRDINHGQKNPDDVFLKPLGTEIHFYTQRPVSEGL